MPIPVTMSLAIDEKILKTLLRQLLRIRLAEEKIVELYPEQQMRCPVHLCIGQEAVAVGVCQHLKRDDVVMSAHRSHGHYLAKGGDLKSLFAELYGKETGCAKGRGGSMHLIDLSVNFWGATPVVGGSIPVAAGIALADHLNQRKNISVVFFGDAAVEEGVFHETLNFAALKKLPVLFVCENNLLSVNTHIEKRQPQRPITNLAQAHGLVCFREDGNDVLKVYETACNAVAHVRSGQGPAFIEFLTYRYREHCGPNEDVGHGSRTKEEFASWQARCPVENFKKYLLVQGVMDENEIENISKQLNGEIDEAVRFAKASPFPQGPLTQKDIYA